MRCKNVLCFFSENPGKISKNKRKDVTYIEYTYDRKYIPEKKYNIPLRTTIGKMNPSDPTISRFLSEICEDERIAFLNDWNEKRNHREKIYISYDSTNKNCKAGDIEKAEYGHPKEDARAPIVNYAIAYDLKNQEPLLYESYPGSVVDVSQLQYVLEKFQGYGYKNIGFPQDPWQPLPAQAS